MATQGRGGRGGGVAVLCGEAVSNAVDSKSQSKGCAGDNSAQGSPILFFLFFHQAIRSELEALHRSALAFATGQLADIKPLVERYRFLRLIYKHHSNAEDEVGSPILFLIKFFFQAVYRELAYLLIICQQNYSLYGK